MDILTAGGIVAFPTETVYGLAACPTVPGALDRLDAVKGRPGAKPYTLHIHDPNQLFHYVPEPPWLAKVLAKKGWPGPITLVVALTEEQAVHARSRFAQDYDKFFHDNTIGLRCPSHPVAARLLAHCPLPVVAPSANPAGEAPAWDADHVRKFFSAKEVDLLLDAGPTRFRGSSTVVKVGGPNLQILRVGALDPSAIDRLARFTILFVCTGNTCRSPMAAGLCRKILVDSLSCREEQLADFKITVESAGTSAASGIGPSPQAVEAMRTFSIDLASYRSRPVSADLVNRADVIFAMTAEHKDFICRLVPGACDRVQLLSRDKPVTDPLGQPTSAYIGCAQWLQDLVRDRLEELFQ